MSRPLRIEFKDAWSHVMNRGRRGEEIFSDGRDYHLFLEIIKESIEMWNIRVAAYCLMPNHYHLLIQTPEANLSRSMRHIDGVYTQRFNRAHGCDGPLFKGRYKSVLVDADGYVLQLVRYIHRNPLRVGRVERLDAYQWSSHQGYLSSGKKWDWLRKDFILSMLTSDRSQWVRAYRQFVAGEDSEEISQIYGRKQMPSVLGTEKFIHWVKDQFFLQKHHKEIPESRTLAPEVETIKEVVSRAYGVGKDNLLKARRGVLNEPRNVAIYLTRQLRRDKLEDICRKFQLDRYSSASSAVERVKIQLLKDRQLRKRLDTIRLELTKGQT
jgi:putative transposase